jgi:DNA-binding NarL/FixJ family response regulator
MPIRVLIADDHPLFRAGVRNELAGQDEIEVIGEAMDGDQALQMTEELCPDVLLLDVQMPGMKAVQIVSRLQRTAQATHVVILSAYNDAPTVQGMLRAGVKGYVVKDEEPAAVLEAIRVVMRGKTWLSPAVAAVVTEALVTEGRPETNEPVLTGRELEVLQLLGQGHNSDQIAEELYISKRTVDYHIDRIMAKLHAHNRTEAYAIAVKNGWIQA